MQKPVISIAIKRRHLAICWAAIGLLIGGPLQAQEERDWTLNLYLENDLFSQTDRDYTSGVRVSLVSPDLNSYVDDDTLPDWLQSVNKRLNFFHSRSEGLERNLVASLGQTIFTPQDREAVELVENDRPYAAWLFGRLGYQTRSKDQLDTLEFSLGVVGPAALGKEAQDFIHDLRDFERFNGWDNQLENELGIMFLWEHRQKMTRIYNRNSQFGFDLIGHAGVALGNVSTYVNAGAELRIGWAIPDDFGTSSLRPGGDNSTPYSNWSRRKTKRDWGMHGFLSLDTRLVGQNIFLDGNTFTDSHSVDREPLVADAAIGVSMYYRGFRLSYAQILRSREFREQDETHSYGSLAISYIF
ncbi:MAG: lipid A deacylase LpxR family protein [Congregibacter sp.]